MGAGQQGAQGGAEGGGERGAGGGVFDDGAVRGLVRSLHVRGAHRGRMLLGFGGGRVYTDLSL